MLVHFAKGELPWDKKEIEDAILECKMGCSDKELTLGLPRAFYDYFKYCHKL